MFTQVPAFLPITLVTSVLSSSVLAQGDWETTRGSERALSMGLQWLAVNQGPEGNWGSRELGLVSLGALAFLADGHMPGRGKYGDVVSKALDHVVRNAKSSGLLNVSLIRRDMYNHGLSTFVLGQAYGMHADSRIGLTLERALKLITQTQCADGGWDYIAKRRPQGHDLSLAVMQAKALRSAMDSGIHVPAAVVQRAILGVRQYYAPQNGNPRDPETIQKRQPGQFGYTKGSGRGTVGIAAAGVVCLQEFGQYDDWRIPKNIDVIRKSIQNRKKKEASPESGMPPFRPYDLYYMSQALYQYGGTDWRQHYPQLRDGLVATQMLKPQDVTTHGKWRATGRIRGKPGELFATAVACFVLAIPNRYLPILQEGRIEGLKDRYSYDPAKADAQIQKVSRAFGGGRRP